MKRRKGRRGLPLLGGAALLLVCFLIVIPFTPIAGKIKRGLKEVFSPEKEEVPVVVAPQVEPSSLPLLDPEERLIDPAPDPPVPTGRLVAPDGVSITKLSKDIDLKVEFKSEEGGLASVERGKRDSYQAEYTLHVTLPKASETLEELERVNPDLGKLLPGLEEMFSTAQVSSWYRKLYLNKSERVKKNVARLDEILTRHNFYDCETMLNMKHPESGRRVFLMQAEMDVVSDGSDGDRLPEMPDEIVKSTYYQPFTSYGWKKQTDVPNPMVKGWEDRIGKAKAEMAMAATSPDRKSWLRDRIKMLERGVGDMKARSFLIAEYDPFIVIPVNLLTDRSDAYAPNVGDYALVIHGKKLYPAIVGDGGPTFKVGEGSLRLAKALNARASPYGRPVEQLVVTYLVFPRSAAAKKSAPNYGQWRIKCGELVEEIGGFGEGVVMHEWEDLLPQQEVE
ncbi:MAG: glycoside hydrolase family 75 protein [Akkermansiaceae bacterium]|nr:glycoside hydrolase family 75 protein [Akkermansiaceae bacterium]